MYTYCVCGKSLYPVSTLTLIRSCFFYLAYLKHSKADASVFFAKRSLLEPKNRLTSLNEIKEKCKWANSTKLLKYSLFFCGKTC